MMFVSVCAGESLTIKQLLADYPPVIGGLG